eukprot:2685626-Prymnesium_polylepis.1
MPEAESSWLLHQHFEIVEPRLLGHGTYGPVVRARDVNTGQAVAIKVYDASDAFHNNRLSDCSTLAEAQERTLDRFRKEVRTMQSIHHPLEAAASDSGGALWLQQLPAHTKANCAQAVAALLSFSGDGDGRPARATDGCCYMVTELGMFSLEQLVRDSQDMGHQPSVPEVRETLRALLSTVATLHSAGCVLETYAPRQLMRFPSGWKITSSVALAPAGQRVDARTVAETPPAHRSPQLAAALQRGQRCAPTNACRRLTRVLNASGRARDAHRFHVPVSYTHLRAHETLMNL